MSELDVRLGSLKTLATRLKDVSHTLCAATLLSGDGFAHVVADTAEGRVVAWDGWYYDDQVDVDTPSLLDAGWEDWDDMPTKLLIRSQADWVNTETRFWLIPHFTVARAAAEVVNNHRDSLTDAETAQRLRNARLVGYLPVVDRDLYEAEVARLRSL